MAKVDIVRAAMIEAIEKRRQGEKGCTFDASGRLKKCDHR